MRKSIVLFLPFILFLGCEKSIQSQMNQYIEFYYPSSGKFYYEITFNWGNYLINTEYSTSDEVSKDSEAYIGFITMRPNVQKTLEGEDLFIYLVTADGIVWTSRDFNIPEEKTRQEVQETKTEYGTSTSTTTITSSSEPIIDDFLNNPSAWTKYGELKSSDGKEFKLQLVEKKAF